MRLCFKHFCLLLFMAFFASEVSAATFRYDLSFQDESGAVIGEGVVRYDPNVKDDLFEFDPPGRCFEPSDRCEFFATWTPLTEFSAVIDGFDIGATFASDLDNLWLEGRGPLGRTGFTEGVWLIGDARDGDFFFTETPPADARFFRTTYDFSLESSDLFLVGEVIMTQVIPVPSSVASLGLGLLVLGGLSRRGRRWRSMPRQLRP